MVPVKLKLKYFSTFSKPGQNQILGDAILVRAPILFLTTVGTTPRDPNVDILLARLNIKSNNIAPSRKLAKSRRKTPRPPPNQLRTQTFEQQSGTYRPRCCCWACLISPRRSWAESSAGSRTCPSASSREQTDALSRGPPYPGWFLPCRPRDRGTRA